jgi:hypothetical protein
MTADNEVGMAFLIGETSSGEAGEVAIKASVDADNTTSSES